MRYRNIFSVGMAVVLAASMPIAALAITTDTTITKNDGGNHQIDDGIDYSGKDYALEVSNSGTAVNVTGDINSPDGAGVSGKDAATITVKGGGNIKKRLCYSQQCCGGDNYG